MFETNFILINHKPSNKFFKNRIFFPLPESNFVINLINATNIYISRLIFIDESFISFIAILFKIESEKTS